MLPEEEHDNVFAPQPAPMNKIKETYRFSMLIKCPQGMRKAYSEVIGDIKERYREKNNKYTVNVDINPYSFV